MGTQVELKGYGICLKSLLVAFSPPMFVSILPCAALSAALCTPEVILTPEALQEVCAGTVGTASEAGSKENHKHEKK